MLNEKIIVTGSNVVQHGKTWWDCVKNDMESLGLSQKDAQSRNKWRRRIKGATANRLTQVHLENGC